MGQALIRRVLRGEQPECHHPPVHGANPTDQCFAPSTTEMPWAFQTYQGFPTGLMKAFSAAARGGRHPRRDRPQTDARRRGRLRPHDPQGIPAGAGTAQPGPPGLPPLRDKPAGSRSSRIGVPTACRSPPVRRSRTWAASRSRPCSRLGARSPAIISALQSSLVAERGRIRTSDTASRPYNGLLGPLSLATQPPLHR
jgi:hypothetical protein